MKILLLEDNEDHAELVKDLLQSAFSQSLAVDWETSLRQGQKCLAENDYDILLCDLNLPDSDFENTIKWLGGLVINAPVVVLTALNDTELGANLVHKGIQDFIVKGQNLDPFLMQRVCTYAIERKQLQLEAEKKNHELDIFCRSLSHNFRGPVRRIGNMLSMIKSSLGDRYDLAADELEYFRFAESNVDSLLSLIEGLHSFLRSEIKANHSSIDLVTLLAELVTLYPQYPAGTVVLERGSLEHAEINGNRSQLFILFQNLIDNGLKYNNHEPKISVNIDKEPTRSCYRVDVIDNGIGFAMEYLDKIFMPFQRLHNDENYLGTGLGLNIVKKIAETHGGEISVASQIDVGSKFSVYLPYL